MKTECIRKKQGHYADYALPRDDRQIKNCDENLRRLVVETIYFGRRSNNKTNGYHETI